MNTALPGEVQFKIWMLEEAERRRANPKTVHKWRKAGFYSHLTFRAVNQRVIFVSGDFNVAPKLFQRNKNGAPFIYNFAGVRFEDGPKRISEMLGCSRTLVSHVARRYIALVIAWSSINLRT
jgi:hypothetical protein